MGNGLAKTHDPSRVIPTVPPDPSAVFPLCSRCKCRTIQVWSDTDMKNWCTDLAEYIEEGLVSCEAFKEGNRTP